MTSRHKWSAKLPFPLANKSERTCIRCDVVLVSRHEYQAGREIHWKEFWRDCEQIKCEATPPCDARLEVTTT